MDTGFLYGLRAGGGGVIPLHHTRAASLPAAWVSKLTSLRRESVGGIGRSQAAALRLAAENARAAVAERHKREEEMSQKLDSEGDELRGSAQSPQIKNRSLPKGMLSEILPTNGLVYSEKGALR